MEARRSVCVLTATEREDISRGLAAHMPCRVIAPRLGRDLPADSRAVQ